jgi:hypothetical protein
MSTINRNFSIISTILNSALASQMYGFLGRSDTVWGNPDVPPLTEISPSDFSDEIIFLKRLGVESLAFMVDRFDWIPKNYSVGDIIYSNNGNVYLCTQAGTSGASPNHFNGILVDNAGTALWEFLETITDDRKYLVSEDLIPLSLLSEKLLYKTPIIIRQIWVSFSIIGDETGYLPLDRKFRVIGIYLNPNQTDVLNDTYINKANVQYYGYPIIYVPIEPLFRTDEQINRFVFQINLEQ